MLVRMLIQAFVFGLAVESRNACNTNRMSTTSNNNSIGSGAHTIGRIAIVVHTQLTSNVITITAPSTITMTTTIIADTSVVTQHVCLR